VINQSLPRTIARADVRSLLARMQTLRVLVVGDVMLDEWVWGVVSRISPEAPVPVVAVSDHSFTLGGAGNVANNLRAIGARVAFSGVIGGDPEGQRVCGLLDDIAVDRTALIAVDDRPTTRKTRIVAHNQQVVRADWESHAPLAAADSRRVCEAVGRVARDYDAVVLSDYAKGLVSRDLVEAANGAPIVTADPKPVNVGLFAGITCVAPNAQEAAAATGIEITYAGSLARAGAALLAQLDCRYVVITRGERGMALFGRRG